LAVLKFCQSYKHLDYLIHLYDLFSLYVSSPPRVYEINRYSGSYLQVYFQTLSFPFFDQLYFLFYDPISGKNQVPENIGNLLTPLGLSYWFSDDASGPSTGRPWSLRPGELRLVMAFFFILMDSLRKTLFYLSLYWMPNSDLQCSLYQHKGQYAIYISAHSKERFIGLIYTFLHPSMKYKII